MFAHLAVINSEDVCFRQQSQFLHGKILSLRVVFAVEQFLSHLILTLQRQFPDGQVVRQEILS